METTENAEINGQYAIFVNGVRIEDGLRTDVALERALEDTDATENEIVVHENPEYGAPVTWVRLKGVFREEISRAALMVMVEDHNQDIDEKRQIVDTSTYGGPEIAAADDGPAIVDERWHEGEACPKCEGDTFDYTNIEDRRVESADGVANIKGMERHHAVLRVTCVGCGHVLRDHPARAVIRDGVPITKADLENV